MNENEIAQAQRSLKSKISNAQGHNFENIIIAGCDYYYALGKAKIEKIPEPFRVTKTYRDGSFRGRFTASAEPDFQGTLDNGRSIVFEAKYTSTEQMKQDVISKAQMEALEKHRSLGALSYVCVGIQDNFYFIPWHTWRDMKLHYGRKYLKCEDISPYRVRFDGALKFLNYMNPKEAQYENLGQIEKEMQERRNQNET